MSHTISKRKSYSVEEKMSGDWIEVWTGFPSAKKARSFARMVDSQRHGKLRVVRVLREPIERERLRWRGRWVKASTTSRASWMTW